MVYFKIRKCLNCHDFFFFKDRLCLEEVFAQAWLKAIWKPFMTDHFSNTKPTSEFSSIFSCDTDLCGCPERLYICFQKTLLLKSALWQVWALQYAPGPPVLFTVARDAKTGTMCAVLVFWHVLEQFKDSKAKKPSVRTLRPLIGHNCLKQPHLGPPPTPHAPRSPL